MKLTIEQKIFITIVLLAGLLGGYFMFFNKEEPTTISQSNQYQQEKVQTGGTYGKNKNWQKKMKQLKI